MTIHDSFIEVTRERDEALRRLAEVEQALRTAQDALNAFDACFDPVYLDGPEPVACASCDGCRASVALQHVAVVLDKGEPDGVG